MAPMNTIGLLDSKVLLIQAVGPASIIRTVPSTEIKAHHPGNRYVVLSRVKLKKSKKIPRIADMFFSAPMCGFRPVVKWGAVGVL